MCASLTVIPSTARAWAEVGPPVPAPTAAQAAPAWPRSKSCRREGQGGLRDGPWGPGRALEGSRDGQLIKAPELQTPGGTGQCSILSPGGTSHVDGDDIGPATQGPVPPPQALPPPPHSVFVPLGEGGPAQH